MIPIQRYLTDPSLNCHGFYKNCVPIFLPKAEIAWLFGLAQLIQEEEEAPKKYKVHATAIKGAIALSLGHEKKRSQ